MKSEKTLKDAAEYVKAFARANEDYTDLCAGLAAFLGVELAPERPAEEKRTEWWGEEIDAERLSLFTGLHQRVATSREDFLALVAAYEAARKAGVLPGLEAQDRGWKGCDPRLCTPEETERAIEAYETARNRGAIPKTEPAAPERPALPEVEVVFSPETEDTHPSIHIGGEVFVPRKDRGTETARLLSIFAETHRRWLAAKRWAEEKEARAHLSAPCLCNLCQMLRILRGEEAG